MKKLSLTLACSLFLFVDLLGQEATPSTWKRQAGLNSANYYQIISEMDTFFKYSPDPGDENGPKAEYDRWKYFWSRRVNAQNGVAGKFRYAKEAMVDWMLNREDYCQGSSLFNSNWECVGPFHVFSSTGAELQYLGLITSVYVFPGNSHILAGSNSGGLWETLDGGNTWECITDDFTTGIPTTGVEAIAVGNSGANIVIGTGSNHISRSSYGIGVCYSADYGQTWNYSSDFLDKMLAIGVAMPFVSELKFKPGSNSIVYAVSRRHVMKSTDGGITWGSGPIYTSNNANIEFQDIEFLPSNASTFFVTGADGNGIGGGTEIVKFTNDGTNSQLLPAFPLSAEFIENGNFESASGSLNDWANSGTGATWTLGTAGLNHYAQNIPLANETPQYIYQTHDFFIEGCRYSLNATISVPQNCTLKIKVMMNCPSPCIPIPNPSETQPFYQVLSVVGPYTGTIQNLAGQTLTHIAASKAKKPVNQGFDFFEGWVCVLQIFVF